MSVFKDLAANSGFNDLDLLAKSKYNPGTLDYDIATEKLTWGDLKTELNSALNFLNTVDLAYTSATQTITNTGGNNAILPLFTDTIAGLVPLSGGGTTNFLRADGTWAAAGADGNGIYDGNGTLQSGSTTVTMSTTDTITFGTDALHIDFNNNLQRVGVNRTTFTRPGAFEVNGATTYNADALYTVNGIGIQIDGTNASSNSMMIFNRTIANSNSNILFQELGTNVGAIQYDLFGSGARKDGIKFYANGFATNGETMFLDRLNDNVLFPNGSIGVGVSLTPLESIHTTSKIRADVAYNINGTDGFTGSGAYTNFTISGGIITNAS